MDKQEYREIVADIRRAYDRKEYDKVLMYANELEIKRVSDSRVLEMVSDAYAASGEVAAARELLLKAYEKTPMGRKIAYKLSELSIRLGDLDEAVTYYEDFCKMAPHDNDRFLLKYKIGKAGRVPKKDLAKVLAAYCVKEMDEKWMAELAALYDEIGAKEKCIEVCDDIILWFADGGYVKKALELKKKNGALTKEQEDKLALMQSNGKKKVKMMNEAPAEEILSFEMIDESFDLRPGSIEPEPQELDEDDLDSFLEEYITIEDAQAPPVMPQEIYRETEVIPVSQIRDAESITFDIEDVELKTAPVHAQVRGWISENMEPAQPQIVPDILGDPLPQEEPFFETDDYTEALDEEAQRIEQEEADKKAAQEQAKKAALFAPVMANGKPFSNIEAMQVARSAPAKDESNFWKMPQDLVLEQEPRTEEYQEPVYGSHRWFEEKAQEDDLEEPIFGAHRYVPQPEEEEYAADVYMEEVEPEPIAIAPAEEEPINEHVSTIRTTSSGAELMGMYATAKSIGDASHLSAQAVYVRKPELGGKKAAEAESRADAESREHKYYRAQEEVIRAAKEEYAFSAQEGNEAFAILPEPFAEEAEPEVYPEMDFATTQRMKALFSEETEEDEILDEQPEQEELQEAAPTAETASEELPTELPEEETPLPEIEVLQEAPIAVQEEASIELPNEVPEEAPIELPNEVPEEASITPAPEEAAEEVAATEAEEPDEVQTEEAPISEAPSPFMISVMPHGSIEEGSTALRKQPFVTVVKEMEPPKAAPKPEVPVALAPTPKEELTAAQKEEAPVLTQAPQTQAPSAPIEEATLPEIALPEEEIVLPEIELPEEEIVLPEIELPEEEIVLPEVELPEEEIVLPEIELPEEEIVLPEIELPEEYVLPEEADAEQDANEATGAFNWDALQQAADQDTQPSIFAPWKKTEEADTSQDTQAEQPLPTFDAALYNDMFDDAEDSSAPSEFEKAVQAFEWEFRANAQDALEEEKPQIDEAPIIEITTPIPKVEEAAQAPVPQAAEKEEPVIEAEAPQTESAPRQTWIDPSITDEQQFAAEAPQEETWGEDDWLEGELAAALDEEDAWLQEPEPQPQAAIQPQEEAPKAQFVSMPAFAIDRTDRKERPLRKQAALEAEPVQAPRKASQSKTIAADDFEAALRAFEQENQKEEAEPFFDAPEYDTDWNGDWTDAQDDDWDISQETDWDDEEDAPQDAWQTAKTDEEAYDRMDDWDNAQLPEWDDDWNDEAFTEPEPEEEIPVKAPAAKAPEQEPVQEVPQKKKTKKQAPAKETRTRASKQTASRIPAEFREELAEFFLIEGMEERISDTIDSLVQKKRAGDPTGGNLIVTGDAKSGKTYLTIALFKIVGKAAGSSIGRVAKVQAEALNGKDLQKVFGKLAGSDLIIENAGYLRDQTIDQLVDIVRSKALRSMIVLEGNELGVENILMKHPELEDLFQTKLDLNELSLSQWADLACDYAQQQGYVIDDMALLALHAKIDEMNIPTTRLVTQDIMDIIDNAIDKARKRSSGRLFGKKNRTVEKVLDETDFM